MHPRAGSKRRRRTRGLTLPTLRKQIDRLDLQLLRLLNDRAQLALRVGQVKRQQGRPVFDARREDRVLDHVARANRGPLSRTSILKVFREILHHSRKLEASIPQSQKTTTTP